MYITDGDIQQYSVEWNYKEKQLVEPKNMLAKRWIDTHHNGKRYPCNFGHVYFTMDPSKPKAGRNITFAGYKDPISGCEPDKPMLCPSIKDASFKSYKWQKPYEWGTDDVKDRHTLSPGFIFKVSRFLFWIVL